MAQKQVVMTCKQMTSFVCSLWAVSVVAGNEDKLTKSGAGTIENNQLESVDQVVIRPASDNSWASCPTERSA